MRFATRKSTDTSLAALAARLYTAPDAGVQAACEAALLAANKALLADLGKVPLGALILAPDVAAAAFKPEARAADESAASLTGVLGRAMDEVVAQIVDDLSEDAADASRSTGTGQLPQVNSVNPNWAGFLAQIVGPGAQARHDASVAARTAAPTRWKPLQDDLDALLARTR